MSDFGTAYFKQKVSPSGVKIAGSFEPLKVRLLYSHISQIGAARVHQYWYSDKRSQRVICLTDGLSKADAASCDCPMCKVGKYPGRGIFRYFAFVQDLNATGDEKDKHLKMLEIPYTLAEQMQETADVLAVPLHDIIFTITKKGVKTDVNYTPIPEKDAGFDVQVFLGKLGLNEFPVFVSDTSGFLLKLDKQGMTNFINGIFPWGSGAGGEGGAESKERFYTPIGSTVTVHSSNSPMQESKEVVAMPKSDPLPESFEEKVKPEQETVQAPRKRGIGF